MKTINRNKAKELIKGSKGLIFSTSFIKKDNTVRILTSRLFIKYKKTGIEPPYKPSDYNLIPLYDMRKKAFRMLNFNTLITLSINKEKYLIEQSEESHFTFDSEGNNTII
tara:strand:+ start:309 stop:638 length:330 start_codon:yes stop_codon:yes gene_type:complete